MNKTCPRITRVRVSNYRSVGRDQTLSLNTFNVLVGPNGSGKSNLVDTISFVRDAMHMGLSGAMTDRGGIAAVRRWSSGRPYNVSIALDVVLEGGSGTYSFEITGDRKEEYRIKTESVSLLNGTEHIGFSVTSGTWSGPEGLEPKISDTALALPTIAGDERFRALFDLLSNPVIYSVFPDTLRRPQKYSPDRPMHRHGDNWVSILRDQDPESWKQEIVAALKRLTGDIDNVKVAKAASYLVAQFHHLSDGKGTWFDAAQESDGTLRVAGILSALLQEPPLTLIGVEEPELTVHPGALPLLMDYLRQASRRSQVLITTHSPELLNHVEPHEVRVVKKTEEGTIVRAMASDQMLSVQEGLLEIGELLMTEGLRQEELKLTPR
ncbi:MAG: AAA family ATPase [Candidatus Delongbacteria bacterium]|nr:AAA family ATPase [Candidatus Delongbacteria bacterium]